MSDLTRRDAIGLAVMGTTACACCALYADPPQPAPAAQPLKDKSTPAKKFSIGKLSDYPEPGFYDNHRAEKVLISVVDDQLVVMSAICTHKSCVLRKKSGELLLSCPCHKSEFSAYGTPNGGPAKIALPRYAVKLAEDGTITVDTTRSFGEREWAKPDAFIAIPKR